MFTMLAPSSIFGNALLRASELPADMKSRGYGHPHDPAWLARKISETKTAISGSISLACFA
ncbi:hypothetical protein [Rhizobium ruizarguesonis]|uniref:hypothetical protein n=1 Tax=Rhizobium ruizarguesonis TaxID=2081791 RepID=UPI00102F3A08|nr:hypothetical protein [Rhizobium ruizarguesonis]TAV04518.1 hypothetical protein ELI39_04035 [Rhizobium ruizarguesonis]